jgi:hypothetical protein
MGRLCSNESHWSHQGDSTALHDDMANMALSGARLYWEYWGKRYFNAKGVSIPVAVSVFPDELYPAPRSWAERAYPKLVHFNIRRDVIARLAG